MFASHPYQRIPSGRRLAVFAPLLALTVILSVVLQIVDAPLKTRAAPQGIVSYELAGSIAAAQDILASWDGTARSYAGFSLGLDYLYMPAYAIAIGLACAWLAPSISGLRGWAGSLGVFLAWGLIAAAVFDACENVALLTMLLAAVRPPWPAIAAVCASIKFLLIASGLIYALTGAAVWAATRSSRA